MKKFLFILFSLFIQFGFGQNWELFPYGQKSFYRSFDTSTLHEVYPDSIYLSTDTIVTLFNIKTSYPELLPCINTIDSINYHRGKIDSGPVFRIGNWILVKGRYFANDYFKLNVDTIIGATWQIDITNATADIDHIVVSYDSITFENIYGLIDSVKYFSIHTDDPQMSEFALDKVKIRLSKSFGLIQFPKLYELVSGRNDYYAAYRPNYLTGYINGIDTIGFCTPELWSDFFQLQPGDFLKFVRKSGLSSSYSSKTIISTIKTDEVIEVNYLDNTGLNRTDFYYRDALRYVLPYRGGTFMYGPPSPHDDKLDDDIDTAVSELYDWYIDTVHVQDTWTVNKYYSNDNWQYPGSCEFGIVMGYGTNTMFNSYMGLVYEAYGDYDYSYEISLAGSIISGYATGNYWPVTIEEQMGNPPELSVYPNPAVNFIQIDIPTNKSFQYSIFTFDGKIISTSELTTNQINIENLIPGIYILEIKNEREILRGKFIKQ